MRWPGHAGSGRQPGHNAQMLLTDAQVVQGGRDASRVAWAGQPCSAACPAAATRVGPFGSQPDPRRGRLGDGRGGDCRRGDAGPARAPSGIRGVHRCRGGVQVVVEQAGERRILFLAAVAGACEFAGVGAQQVVHPVPAWLGRPDQVRGRGCPERLGHSRVQVAVGPAEHRPHRGPGSPPASSRSSRRCWSASSATSPASGTGGRAAASSAATRSASGSRPHCLASAVAASGSSSARCPISARSSPAASPGGSRSSSSRAAQCRATSPASSATIRGLAGPRWIPGRRRRS
jgi:hypothetical protein